MKQKYKYLAGNTLIFTISSFGSKLLSFLFVPLYTSILTTSEYGLADLVFTTTTLLVYVFTLNIADAVLRFVIDDVDNRTKIIAYGIRITVIGALICGALLIITMKTNIIQWPPYCYYFLFFYYVLMSVYNLFSNYARAIDKVKQVAVAGVVTSIAVISGNIVFLICFKWRLVGYLLASTLSIFVGILYIGVSAEISLPSILREEQCDNMLKKRMLRYSIPLIFNGIAWWINSAFDRYLITYMRGTEQNGLYSVASKIPLVIATVNAIFGQAWALSVIKDVSDKDEDGFFSNTYNYYNFILVSAGSIMIWLNIPIARILFSKDFYSAWRFSSILILSAIFNALSSFLGGAFTRSMKTDIYAKTTIVATVTNIVLNIILINKIGTIGAAIATTTSFFVMWMVRYILAGKYVSMNVDIAKHILSYCVLLAQIIVEHLYGRYNNIQILGALIVCTLYRKEIIILIDICLKKISHLLLNRK